MRPLTRIALAIALVALALPPQAGAQRNGLAKTPPLGWNSWYAFHCRVNEREVVGNALALINSGMADAGYRYVIVDGCWEAPRRGPDGALAANPKTFPHGIAQLADTIHALGLKFGIYTSAGRRICNHPLPGSHGHFRQDMRTFAAWGADYVKVDWCAAAPGEQQQAAYAEIARAAGESGRRMLVTVSTPGYERPWLWAHRYGNTWRIAPDVLPTWRSLMSVLDADAPLYPYAGPGGWNDADILQVGSRQLSASEQRAHISLWAMLASPLLAGNDLRGMSAPALSILRNPDVIALDQDRLGRQGRRVGRANGHELWLRQLAGGAWALLLLNRGTRAGTVTLDLSRLTGLPHSGRYAVRDLWTHQASTTAGRVKLRVARHDVVLLRVRPG